jgi:NAD(P)-dependent dehydrogenase (short-subunit alcohol dehydrogenase family)
VDQFLEGRNAVVTGATRGIGRAIAEALLDAGASLAICARNAQDVEIAVTELAARSKSKVIGKAADVSKKEDVAKLFQFVDQELAGLDLLVNNAGVGVFKTTAELTADDWQSTIGTNLTGVFYCCREALSRLRNRKDGYIVNIGSLAGKNAFAGGAAYNASKFGLNGFTEAMMLDHRQDGIRVSTVMPGSVATGFGSGNAADWKIAPADIAEIVLMLFRMPARTLVSRVEVRPTRPNK